MRSLLEWAEGKVELNNAGEAPVHTCSGLGLENDTPSLCPVCLAFGAPAAEAANQKRLVGPTRLIIRDAYLTPESQADLERFQRDRGLPMTEYKTENAIDRITAAANPRPMERTIRGTAFDLEMVYRIYSIPTAEHLHKVAQELQSRGKISEQTLQDCEYDDGRASVEHLSHVCSAMQLVEDTYLGGGGARGSGEVSFWFEPLPTVHKKEYYLEGPIESNEEAESEETEAESHEEPALQPLSEELKATYIRHVAETLGISLES